MLREPLNFTIKLLNDLPLRPLVRVLGHAEVGGTVGVKKQAAHPFDQASELGGKLERRVQEKTHLALSRTTQTMVGSTTRSQMVQAERHLQKNWTPPQSRGQTECGLWIEPLC